MSSCSYCVKCKEPKEANQFSMCIRCIKETQTFLAQTFAIDSDDLADLGVATYKRKQQS